MTKYVCENCESPRLISVRKDSDWGFGGDLWQLNPSEDYETDDPSCMDEYDIMFTVCLKCGIYNSVKEVIPLNSKGDE